MPAAAVIPAPIAYIKVVAVKKLVVEFLRRRAAAGSPAAAAASCCHRRRGCQRPRSRWLLYCEKIKVFQAGVCSYTSAWNNKISSGLACWLLNQRMIDRDSWGSLY